MHPSGSCHTIIHLDNSSRLIIKINTGNWLEDLYSDWAIRYGWGCTVAWRPNFSIMLNDTTLAQLPPSIINEHTLPSTVQREWKMFSRCSSLTPHWFLSTHRMTSISPSSVASTISLCPSSCSSSSFSFYSSSWFSSLVASHWARVIILRFGQSEVICPSH